jgi:hypothetical protein
MIHVLHRHAASLRLYPTWMAILLLSLLRGISILPVSFTVEVCP